MSVSMKSLPIYEKFFSPSEAVDLDWQELNTSPEEDVSFSQDVDFSVNTDVNCFFETVKKIAIIILKIVLFPWGLYDLTRYAVQRIVMAFLYPAQSKIANFVMRFLFPSARASITTEFLDQERASQAADFRRGGYIVRHVKLEKDGTNYSGLLIGHRDTIANGRWALQATGNFEPIEHTGFAYAHAYREEGGYNTLLVNGPGVGRSEGEATPDTMGDAQEVGITFLETALKAESIVLAGRSLGSGAVGNAVMKHEFKKDVTYLVVSQTTFDRASNICAKIVANFFLEKEVARRFRNFEENVFRDTGSRPGCWDLSKELEDQLQPGIVEALDEAGLKLVPGGVSVKEKFWLSSFAGSLVKKMVFWAGCEIDRMEASRRLQELGIRELVTQSGSFLNEDEVPTKETFLHDGVILSKASHGRRLVKDGILEGKVFHCTPCHHSDFPLVVTKA